MNDQNLDFTIERLGPYRLLSPMQGGRFTGDDERLLYHSSPAEVRRYIEAGKEPPALELAGPRNRVYFDPATIACGIVTCGGLCPGLNDVIRAVTLGIYHHYGVKRVYGFRYGYEGLVKRLGHTPLDLSPASVSQISDLGEREDQHGGGALEPPVYPCADRDGDQCPEEDRPRGVALEQCARLHRSAAGIALTLDLISLA